MVFVFLVRASLHARQLWLHVVAYRGQAGALRRGRFCGRFFRLRRAAARLSGRGVFSELGAHSLPSAPIDMESIHPRCGSFDLAC